MRIMLVLLALLGPQDRGRTGKPYIDMDYGPYLSASLEVGPGNIAYKGIAIRLDKGDGGVSAGRAFMLFETDTLRWAAGWTGEGFIDWRNILFDGSHTTHAKIRGDRVFANPVAPGWGAPTDGSFEDPRLRGRDDKPYGPLPREWGKWKGLYVHGDKVVLSYRIGGTDVLETPSLEGNGVFARTLRMGPRTKDLIVQVAREGGPAATPSKRLTIKPTDKFNFTTRDYTFTARVKTDGGGSLIAHAPARGAWRPNGKTLFIRDGRLVFDIGWVGQVQSQRRIRSGRWHDVAMTWEHETGKVRFFVDGKAAGGSGDTLKPKRREKDFVVHFGYTSTDFPGGGLSTFTGEYEEARIFDRALSTDELKSVKETKKGLLGRWVPGEAEPPKPTDLSITTTLKGAEWITADGHRRLKIPAGEDPIVFKILIGGEAKNSEDPVDPTPLTKGGPAAWTEEVKTTPTTRGAAADPYVVDVLTVPMNNPYRSFMRLGGFDFFKDARKAAVCTWMGDVWIVDGLGGGNGTLTWKRIAAGMFQPLGVKIVDETIYVTCRDQITRLRDLNGDGETDFYESFNHDHQVTEHFHEFAMGLQTDPEGNFYYAKSARHAKDSLIPHHGTLIKVSKDGSKSEIVCNGFRAANGVGFGPKGELATSDQQGHWTPANRINLVKPGAFYGNMYSYHQGEKPTSYEPPTVWLPQKFDRSPSEQLWVPDDRWGPFKGKMLSLSYGKGRILHVMYEKTGGVYQGAAFKFPWDFPTGTMRGRFHPDDGQFYLCGLFGWAGDKTRPGGFYRIRYTGKPVHVPLAHTVRKDGVDLTFTCALDKEQAEDADRWLVKRWNYKWAARYGSDHYSVANPGRRGEDTVAVKSAILLDDGRTVRLTIEDFKPVMQMEIRYGIKAADGTRLRDTVYSTINALPK